MTTTSDGICDLFNTALLNTTGAGANVFGPRDWPTTIDEMPIILVQSPTERKEGLGRNGAPSFNVTATIRVVGRMTAVADTDDAGAQALRSALGLLQRQIEIAIINRYEIMVVLQQVVSVDSNVKVTSEAEQHIGELAMDFAVEFYQGPEDFAVPAENALADMAVYADLVNVFVPVGTYSAAEPFDAADGILPTPRSSGPDGRPEGAVVIPLT